MAEREKLIELKDLQITFGSGKKKFVAVDHVNFDIYKGETFSLVGESGSGKTTIGRAICRINPTSGGDIFFKGQKINGKIPHALDKQITREIQMIFQDPYSSLNPAYPVEWLLEEPLRIYGKYDGPERKRRVREMLERVELPEEVLKAKPSELSGGQRQRVALARALAIEPQVLVLDEPLSNLDAKVRLNVRHEIKSLQKRLGFTSLIVTHDQQEALVMADRIAVLNQGRIEQTGTPEEIYQRPATPFVADFMGADNKIISGELSAAAISGLSAAQQGDNVIYFRSADAALAELTQPAPQEGLALEGVVEQSAFLGNLYRHSVRCHDRLLLADAAQCWPTKSRVRLHVPTPALHIFPLPLSQ